jgi:hypothetical protein
VREPNAFLNRPQQLSHFGVVNAEKAMNIARMPPPIVQLPFRKWGFVTFNERVKFECNEAELGYEYK